MRLKRPQAAAVDGLLLTIGTIYVVFLAENFINPFQSFLITLGVPLAAWAGIMIADLALLVDGDPQTLDKWADALADNEHARDLRFEAAKAAKHLEDAGADFEVPADLEQRILAAVDARGGTAPQVEPRPEPPPGGGVTQPQAHADTVADAPRGLPAPTRKSNRMLVGGLVVGGLVAIAAGMGGYNHFALRPALELRPTDPSLVRHLRISISIESAMFFVVIVLTAILVGSAT